MKLEIRNPKNTHCPLAPGAPPASRPPRRVSRFGLRISFGFRISDFGFCRPRRAFLLIDCLVYIGLLLLLLTLVFMTFYRVLEHSKRLNRTAADITRALRAGERWRADVRAATAPPRLDPAGADPVLHLPRGPGEILYAFREGAVLRQDTSRGETNWALVLSEVQSSRLMAEPRRHVTAWRWELELAPRSETQRTKTLFTFAAVPAGRSQP